MDKNGKMVDVIIEDITQIDPQTGITYKAKEFKVWADKNMKQVIADIPGVSDVFCIFSEWEYVVYLDPRYDREFLRAEIEAQIKIHMELEKE